MEYRYLVGSHHQLTHYQTICSDFILKIEAFLQFLQETYSVTDLPRTVILTDFPTATQGISSIPVPAYTNDFRTVFCPDLEIWKGLYLRQLEKRESAELRQYYTEMLSSNHVLQILGHEFVHHSDFFLDEAYEKGIWFEEGMCEYISRKYFLTAEEFDREVWANSLLTAQYEQQYGSRSLDDFEADTYREDYVSIFHGYWKSFLAVHGLVERYQGDVRQVFQEYQRWHASAAASTLAQWFHLE